MLLENSNVLLAGDAQAVKKVVNVGFREQTGVLERSQVRVDLVVLLNSFDDVSLALKLQHFLRDHSVAVVKGHVEVIDVAHVFVQVGRMAEGALVVGYGPGGC